MLTLILAKRTNLRKTRHSGAVPAKAIVRELTVGLPTALSFLRRRPRLIREKYHRARHKSGRHQCRTGILRAQPVRLSGSRTAKRLRQGWLRGSRKRRRSRHLPVRSASGEVWGVVQI